MTTSPSDSPVGPDTPSARAAAPAAIPPEVYDIAFGWDPSPEVERLLFCCRSTGLQPRSALELGCGTGRLLREFQKRVTDLAGLDLSPEMLALARTRTAATLVHGDMSDFALGRRFDLIYTSANTLRCVTDPTALPRMWRCIADHLNPGGVFAADLELGIADEAAKVHQPAAWSMSRGEILVHAAWTVITPPAPTTRCCRVRWTFEVREGTPRGRWEEELVLRTYDADELLALACADGRLVSRGLYLLRDPYLFETPPEKAAGRMLMVLQRTSGDSAAGA